MTIAGDIAEERFEEFIQEIANLALDGLGIDGGHHKQYFLEEIAKRCVPKEELQKFYAEYWVEEVVIP